LAGGRCGGDQTLQEAFYLGGQHARHSRSWCCRSLSSVLYRRSGTSSSIFVASQILVSWDEGDIFRLFRGVRRQQPEEQPA